MKNLTSLIIYLQLIFPSLCFPQTSVGGGGGPDSIEEHLVDPSSYNNFNRMLNRVVENTKKNWQECSRLDNKEVQSPPPFNNIQELITYTNSLNYKELIRFTFTPDMFSYSSQCPMEVTLDCIFNENVIELLKEIIRIEKASGIIMFNHFKTGEEQKNAIKLFKILIQKNDKSN